MKTKLAFTTIFCVAALAGCGGNAHNQPQSQTQATPPPGLPPVKLLKAELTPTTGSNETNTVPAGSKLRLKGRLVIESDSRPPSVVVLAIVDAKGTTLDTTPAVTKELDKNTYEFEGELDSPRERGRYRIDAYVDSDVVKSTEVAVQ